MRRFLERENESKTGVLLYCGDHDPSGLDISGSVISDIESMSTATGYFPDNLIVDRFGLNFHFIEAEGLSWSENLVTSSGEDLALCVKRKWHLYIIQLTLIVLPFVGLVLNGVTTVIYGSVPSYAAPERRTHALSVFYTITIGAAAASPPAAGFIGDLIGIPGTVAVVSALTLATIPLAFLLKDPRDTASV